MPNDQAARDSGLERLDAFIGHWREQITFPGASPSGIVGHTAFEWILDRAFLLQRSVAPDSDVPDSIAIVAFDPVRDTYTQHYFDSRNVTRLYAMDFRNGVWSLLRDAPDFSPLSFSQRFTGTFSHDDNTIVARWERSHDGSNWETDFDMTFTRVK